MQGTLERAIAAVTGEDITLAGAGRTDAGAHALGQVVSFATESTLSAGVLMRAMNAHLPDDIAVVGAAVAESGFQPRRDATSRTYRYVIWNRRTPSPFLRNRAAHVRKPLDADVMHCALQALVGRHDFSSFVPVRTERSRVRTVFRAECHREGDVVFIELEATGFIKQMVRSIAGTAILVGTGQATVADFATILEARDRSRAGETAPAAGLYLLRVKYEASPFDDDTTHCGALTDSYRGLQPVEIDAMSRSQAVSNSSRRRDTPDGTSEETV